MSPSSNDPYKYQWARYVARTQLDQKFSLINEKISAQQNVPLASDIAELTNRVIGEETSVKDSKLTGEPPTHKEAIHVGIVGAGSAGLFTALTIDFINKQMEKKKLKLNITYDILEANGEPRLGGRLYTHYFTDPNAPADPTKKKLPHDYYDVGAMRFPENDVMKRTFQLFKFLGLTKGNGGLVPYYLKDYRNVCPSYFNNIGYVGPPPKGPDPYKVNADYKPEDPKGIPAHLLTEDPSKLVEKAIEPFVTSLKEDIKNQKLEGWKILMAADRLSTRQFFRSTVIPTKEGDYTEVLKERGPGYNFNTTEWLETFAYATGWYNQSLAETVLEELDFGTEGETTEENTNWLCVEGGTQKVARLMSEKLVKKPEFHRQVTKISTAPDGTVSLTLKHMDAKPQPTEEKLKLQPTDEKPRPRPTETRDYFAVFNSTTLGALQRMDLRDAGLRYGTKQAIRSLGYGASCKVGMKFKTAWWKEEPHFINRGGLSKTDRPLRVCVYPSYSVNDGSDQPSVLLCSYTWAQDAQRIGTLIDPKSPNNEEELKELLLNDLALLHSTDAKPYEKLRPELEQSYITHHAWDWYNDPNMSGAFAYFGPNQFSEMWPELIAPNGWLFLIGEAASAHHAWIVGALESAIRGIYQMLDLLLAQDPKHEPYQAAVALLKDDYKEEDLPFGPLPLEIPETQLRDDKKAPKADVLDDVKKGVPLSFTTAQVLLSFIEKVAEAADAKVPS